MEEAGKWKLGRTHTIPARRPAQSRKKALRRQHQSPKCCPIPRLLLLALLRPPLCLRASSSPPFRPGEGRLIGRVLGCAACKAEEKHPRRQLAQPRRERSRQRVGLAPNTDDHDRDNAHARHLALRAKSKPVDGGHDSHGRVVRPGPFWSAPIQEQREGGSARFHARRPRSIANAAVQQRPSHAVS